MVSPLFLVAAAPAGPPAFAGRPDGVTPLAAALASTHRLRLPDPHGDYGFLRHNVNGVARPVCNIGALSVRAEERVVRDQHEPQPCLPGAHRPEADSGQRVA